MRCQRLERAYGYKDSITVLFYTATTHYPRIRFLTSQCRLSRPAGTDIEILATSLHPGWIADFMAARKVEGKGLFRKEWEFRNTGLPKVDREYFWRCPGVIPK